MKIKLRKKKKIPFNYKIRQWSESEPFFLNHNGSLIHRAREVCTHLTHDGKDRHTSVVYWCGNLGAISHYGHHGELLAVPPKDRLVCARCEAIAVAQGEQSASKLAGRHVHVGRMVPQRTCCRENKN